MYDIHTLSIVAKKMYERLVLPPPITNNIVMMFAMMFAQRLTRYGNARDRRIMAKGTWSNTENTKINS